MLSNTLRPLFSLLGAAALLVPVACGSGSSDDDDGSSGSRSGDNEYVCCLNGSFYECPDGASLEQCTNFDTSGCSGDSSRDDECNG